jgi:hypothetical protein
MNFLLTCILTYILACRNGRRDVTERSGENNNLPAGNPGQVITALPFNRLDEYLFSCSPA